MEALKVVLSEIATGEREGKVLALVDVRRACFYAPARRKVFVDLPPEEYQPGDEHMCGLLRYSLYGTRAAQNWEEELASTLSGLGLTRGSACPCVWRGRIKGEDIVHRDDITVGGQRSAVESLIKMTSKKYEIKKQVLGGDPDFEKSGRILNRVIEWDRDGITIEADQRHVREIMKGLELERATSYDIEHSLLESVTCHNTAQTSSSQQCRYAVRWPTPQCVTRNVLRGSEDTSLADREQSAGSAGRKVGNWRRIQTWTGEATRPLGDQSQAGSS